MAVVEIKIEDLKMTNEKIQKILENHKHWLKEDTDGWEKMRANLRGANLWEANLREANLRGANLWEANLWGANLWETNLREANLRGANLRGASLRGADLRGADLRGADLRGADLVGAKINENTKINLPISCPDTGAFTAWKKARGYIVQLEIPAEAKRVSATTRKCRCNMAKVVAIQNVDGTDSDLREVCSGYDHNFIYKVGETVVVDNFDDNRWNECSTGIHFFITREEAVDY